MAFAREGADVLISYLPEEEEDAKETERLVKEAGRKIVKVPGDVRTQEQCEKIVSTAVKELGGIGKSSLFFYAGSFMFHLT